MYLSAGCLAEGACIQCWVGSIQCALAIPGRPCVAIGELAPVAVGVAVAVFAAVVLHELHQPS